MITTIARQSGLTPPQVLADAGDCSTRDLTAIAATPINALLDPSEHGGSGRALSREPSRTWIADHRT